MLIQCITIFIITLCFYPVHLARYITDVPVKSSSTHIQDGTHGWTHTPCENFPSHIRWRKELFFKAQQNCFCRPGADQWHRTHPKLLHPNVCSTQLRQILVFKLLEAELGERSEWSGFSEERVC